MEFYTPLDPLRAYAELAEPRLASFLDQKVAELSRLPLDLQPAPALLRA